MKKIHVYAGKGGVGKTSCSVSHALYLAREGIRTAVIDYDGGHSVVRTLGLVHEYNPNQIYIVETNLSIAIIDNVPFTGIEGSKTVKMELAQYLAQFKEDDGLIAFPDMIGAFFGVPTDVPSTQKFVALVRVLMRLLAEGYEHVIIDVEPTAGLQRLLNNAESLVRSLGNLKRTGRIILGVLGAKWPDIKGFIQGPYMQDIDTYCRRIKNAAILLRKASYILVTVPEESPVNQTFLVRKIITEFGGKVRGCVVNNIRSEKHEREFIQILDRHDVPIEQVQRDPAFHGTPSERRQALLSIGEGLYRRF